MKQNIHPQVYNDTVVTCACGNSFVTQSTKKTITVDICSACHPFYTGTQKLVDTEGRIEKFSKRMQKAQPITSKKAKIKGKKAEKKTEEVKPLTLKQLLEETKQSTEEK